MGLLKNDPALWSTKGIEDALDETIDEMGIAVDYGYICLGTIYPRTDRRLDSSMAMPSFPRKEVVELWGTLSVDEGKVQEFLHADAAVHLAPGTRYQLRKRTPTRFGRSHGMAWYRNAAMDKQETWGHVSKEPTLINGVYLVGEFTTPSD
jgi:hypothetical protein